MAGLDLVKQDFQSLSENVPRMKLSNMYTVENPLSLAGYSYIPRPTLQSFTEIGLGPIRGIWYQSSQGTTIVYVVAGTNLYSLNTVDGTYTTLGPILGTDFCTFASTIYYIAISANGVLYIWDGTTLTPVDIPDGQRVTDVTSLDNYLIVGIENSTKFYWVQPGELTIDPLSFTSAERNPDDIVSVMTTGDELWVLGQSSCEVFTDTGDAAAPFQRISGRAYSTGCVDKHSVVKTLKETLPCLIWVTPTKEVVLSQGTPSKISNEAIEEALKASTTFTAWAFRTNRHDFYVLTTEIATLVYDITVGSWYRWTTYQKDTWNAVSGIHINDTVYCVTNFDGKVYKLSYENSDANLDFLVCEVSGYIPNVSIKPTPCNNITLLLNYGFSKSYTVAPIIELRWSDDGGHTWSSYMQGLTGSRGLYDTNISFRSLGKIARPGRYVELRFSEVQSFRLDGATFND